jgi:hypothetical protein
VAKPSDRVAALRGRELDPISRGIRRLSVYLFRTAPPVM